MIDTSFSTPGYAPPLIFHKPLLKKMETNRLDCNIFFQKLGIIEVNPHSAQRAKIYAD